MHPSSPTNFPQGNKPESTPNAELSPREMIERAMNSVIMEMMQVRRTLWLILQQTGPITVDETQTHPLWRMKATRLEDGKTKLEATQLPEPTPEQIKEVVDILHGTMTPLEEAMEKTALRDHPPVYIQMLITPHIIQADNGYWVDAALARITMSEPNPGN
jgi:hypothetical protein